MKTMGILIDASRDCAIAENGVKIPFLSRIQPQSVRNGAENDNGPLPGAGEGSMLKRLNC